MSKTRQEIRNHLDSLVGTKVVCTNNRSLDGQCVTLIKNLLAFLGCPTAWNARGNAKDVAAKYVADGIAKNGDGWLRVCTNKGMGGGYGHVWIDLQDETNYECNGAKALHVTKGTRPISQAQTIVNLDQWVKADASGSGWDTKGIPAGATPQSATFTASVDRNIRRAPNLNGKIVGTFTADGVGQRYDCYVDGDGYRWVSWIGASGHRNYTAVRRLSDNKRYGTCK